jgi:hypothetical protein
MKLGPDTVTMAANEPQREREDDDRAGEDRDVQPSVRVHAKHVGEHDDRHRRAHHDRHVGARLRKVEVLQ